jgi:hypothetical protein
LQAVLREAKLVDVKQLKNDQVARYFMSLFQNLQQYAKITIAPEKIPPVPNPAMALPTMRAVLLGATPQTREPSSNMPMAVKKTNLICSIVSSLTFISGFKNIH